MPYIRFTTRGLMIAVAVLAVEGVILVEAAKLGPGIEFTLFIGSVFLLLNLLFSSYLDAARKINEAPPEKQTAAILNLGCFLILMMMAVTPVVLVVLLRSQK